MAGVYASHNPIAIHNNLDIPHPGYMDQNGFVHIPITIAEYIDPSQKLNFVDKVRSKASHKTDQKPQMFAMSQRDYVNHWAKDEDGEWLPNVTEPPEGRLAWLRTQVRVNEEWKQWGALRDITSGKWSWGATG
ncbi:unnamed protein product [Zymoseptoria tritici ST99CH_3D7]|uniref:Uncharacterized protein n=1 Tax=Zymoseptoria tritici (strain ST99CH_3D7) TaxID=1276538 RepID=A0A1X7RRR2_ZYMT9|nr:unnamed protein product [Zymoseptoria tritici ST99CH_3D7]